MRIKTFKIRLLAILLATLYGAAGCVHNQDDDRELIALASLATAYSVDEGSVVFPDEETFNTFIKTLNSDGGDAIFQEHQRRLSSLGPAQFKPLTPAYDIENTAAIQAYDAEKRKRIAAENPSLSAAQVAAMVIDDEDTLIADPYFAGLLNTDRELVVGDTRYKYTGKGVFMAARNNTTKLRAAAASFQPNKSIHAKPQRYNIGNGVKFFPQEFSSKVREGLVPMGNQAVLTAKTSRLLQPSNECIQQIAAERFGPTAPHLDGPELIKEDRLCGGGGGGGGGGSTGGGSSGGSKPPAGPPHWSKLPKCDKLSTGLFAKLFGPKIVCTQYWESRKRVKTKMWNQNYLIYASIGISVRSQSRRFRIWWAKKTDELILGYNSITFDYNIPQFNPFGAGDYQKSGYTYAYKGHVVNQYGQWQNPGGGKLWNTSAFPIGSVNNNWLEIQIYLPLVHNIGKTVSTTDLNNYAESAVRSAIKDFANKQVKPDSKTPTVMTALTTKKARFIFHNWRTKRTNSRAIRNIFDWNTAQVSVTFHPGSGSSKPKLDIESNARSYDLILADLYGIGRRGRTWKGNRVLFTDKK